MPETPAEWLESQADRTFARQRAEVDTAKLVATFSTGVTTTLVATSLQVGEPNGWDLTGVILLAAAVLAVFYLILLDRITESDQNQLLEISKLNGWTDAQLVNELRTSMLKATYVNTGVVTNVRRALVGQVFLSLMAGIFACISLLR
ncbi:hypothetical protein Axi01nite_93930 [Actinoplanes xinjiangensis]|nr:hypothetical protein Axi01nite_93930 [Actinoplanes xinjiangensis]